MSQKVSTRKGGVNEDKDKEKGHTESPAKDIKKKVAATTEKEKQTTDKPEKAAEKNAEKSTDKADKNVDKDKKTDKNVEKADKKTEKNAEKSDKKTEKVAEKKSEVPEKVKEDSSKGEKSGKEKQEDKRDTRKQNGKEVHNGVSDVTLSTNGNDEPLNGTVSESDDDEILVIDDHEQDELFPELTYDDTSDLESFEPATPENAPSRSLTRRSQAKSARTPETPRPASERPPEPADDSKDSKILKMKDDALATDRKLRSADSPKPESKKPQEKGQDSPKQTQESPKKQDKDAKKSQENESKQDGEKESEKSEVEVVVEVEGAEGEARKPDTNYSKSRVKVSPYRRSGRLADHTASSVMANYTGNNTTMEMDITESSSFVSEDVSLDDSYLSGLRSIRGRRSYKPLKEMTLRNVAANRSTRSVTSVNLSEQPSRPTGTVVGRKRKPDSAEIELGEEAAEATLGKRMRLLDRIAQPFRRTLASTPLPARRAAEIVGINTDLPLSAPVSSCDTFDPETLKASSTPLAAPPPAPTPTLPLHEPEKDGKRCIVM